MKAAQGLKIAAGAGKVAKATKAITTVKAAPKTNGLVTFAKNAVRMGATKDEAFRVSFGPAPKHYDRLGKIGKAMAPLHIHVGTKKIGIDFNWIKKPFYKTYRKK